MKHFESDLYEYVRVEKLFDSPEGAPKEEKMGCEWSMKRTGNKIKAFRYLKEPFIKTPGVPRESIEVSITDAALVLYRNGIGFFGMSFHWQIQ